MAQVDAAVPETHVLAVASHVTSGYVGNTMATFCMQTLGCEVSAIHTVNYSNHVAYKTFTGRKSSPEEIAELYAGLKSARLDAFDMMLSGYCPSASLIDEVGRIARDARRRATTKPGAFFWVLDPVMGDNGRLYVADECVAAYKQLLRDADLILPNQFEAELLAEVEIADWASMQGAVETLHRRYAVPHVLITSVRVPGAGAGAATTTSGEGEEGAARLAIIGSTATSTGTPRLFRITVPAFPVFFSGTGDMLAALLVARLRQAADQAGVLHERSWRSPDDVSAPELPLAKATERALASMHAVLKDTAERYQAETEAVEREEKGSEGESKEMELEKHLRLTRAAEVRVVRNTGVLREPPDLGEFKAMAVEVRGKSVV